MGKTPAPDFIVTDYAMTLIRVKARQLCRRPEFNASEQDDVRQDLWLHLAAKAHHFDPRRASLNTFTDRVVCSQVRMLLRSRRRRRRTPWSGAISLERTMVDVDGTWTPISQTVSEDDLLGRIHRVLMGDMARLENADAFAVAVRAMPAHLRRACRLLIRGTISSTARDLTASRRQVRNAMQLIRGHFERAGLGNR